MSVQIFIQFRVRVDNSLFCTMPDRTFTTFLLLPGHRDWRGFIIMCVQCTALVPRYYFIFYKTNIDFPRHDISADVLFDVTLSHISQTSENLDHTS